jgi:ribosomal protein L31E
LKLLVLLLVCLPALCGQAERFLTVDEALRVCFPDAKEFRPFTVELRPEQVKAIERDTKQKIRKREFKAWLAEPGGVLMIDQVIGKHDFIDYAVALTTGVSRTLWRRGASAEVAPAIPGQDGARPAEAWCRRL